MSTTTDKPPCRKCGEVEKHKESCEFYVDWQPQVSDSERTGAKKMVPFDDDMDDWWGFGG